MKTVSVILTTYNSEKYIHRTIQSILHQDGKDKEFYIELIVVDDCSTDHTLKCLQNYNDINIVSSQQNSGGPNKGRNIGLKKATGDYICIADHDDEWKTYKIKRQLKFIEEAPIVTSGYTLKDSSLNKTIERTKTINNQRNYILYKENVTFLKKLSKSKKGQSIYLGSIMFQKELKNVLFEEYYGSIDFDWVLRLFYQQKSIEICESLYIRHVDGSNLSLNDTYRKNDFYFSLSFIENYDNEYPEAVKKGILRIHGSRARYYFITNNMKKARFYFLRSDINLKTILYYFSTFIGANFIKKHFKVFG